MLNKMKRLQNFTETDATERVPPKPSKKQSEGHAPSWPPWFCKSRMNKKHEHKGDPSAHAETDPEHPQAGGEVLKSAAEIALEKPASPAESHKATQKGTVTISQEELDALHAQAAKAQENWDRLLRTQADLENYRKRVARERQDLIQSANERLLLDLLTPLDHFEMGLEISHQDSATDSLREGVKMVFDQFQQFLKEHGLTEIQALGQPFDPATHEAVSQQESDAPEGQVIQQIRKGYRLKNKVLRPATVVVSKGKADASITAESLETAPIRVDPNAPETT